MRVAFASLAPLLVRLDFSAPTSSCLFAWLTARNDLRQGVASPGRRVSSSVFKAKGLGPRACGKRSLDLRFLTNSMEFR